ncbi:hypothetical protein P3T19_004740, partial [Paraburkholderia sp. GAS205]
GSTAGLPFNVALEAFVQLTPHYGAPGTF